MALHTDSLWQLLPAIHRLRDERSGGPLRALLELMATQGALVQDDIEQLHDDHFIETCAEWVVPYIGELVGMRGLRDLGTELPYSRRALVANVLAYRRRKGTVPVLEQLVLDSAGWPAKAAEAFLQLATTQHLNHVRLQAPATLDLRSALRLQALGGAFDGAPHSVDVRRIAPQRGRWNLPNVALFAWRLRSYRLLRAEPRPGPQPGSYWLDAAGRDMPMFNPPRTEAAVAHATTEADLPMPLSRLALHAELQARRLALANGRPLQPAWFDEATGQPPLVLRLDGVAVPPDQLCVCHLGSWQPPPDSVEVPRSGPGGTVTPVAWPIAAAFDPQLGRLVLAPARVGAAVQVDWNFGFPGDLGGGPYDRRRTLDEALARPVAWQLGVSRQQAAIGSELVATLAEAIDAWNLQPAGTVGLITLMDNAAWDEDWSAAHAPRLPAGSRLTIAAADWPALPVAGGLPGQLARRPGRIDGGLRRAALRGNLTVIGTAAADEPAAGELWLDGLLIEGSVTVADGNLARLQLAHCTVLPAAGPALAAVGDNRHLRLKAQRCLLGRIEVSATADGVGLADTIVQAEPEAIQVDSAPLEASACTIVGRCTLDRLCAENTLFTATVHTARLQEGCVRHSFVSRDSSVPRPYRCQPALAIEAALAASPAADPAAIEARLRPTFTTLRWGDAAHAQLSAQCAAEITTGADDGNEMGAWHFLLQAHRTANALGQVGQYLRFGMEAGLTHAS